MTSCAAGLDSAGSPSLWRLFLSAISSFSFCCCSKRALAAASAAWLFATCETVQACIVGTLGVLHFSLKKSCFDQGMQAALTVMPKLGGESDLQLLVCCHTAILSTHQESVENVPSFRTNSGTKHSGVVQIHLTCSVLKDAEEYAYLCCLVWHWDRWSRACSSRPRCKVGP